MAKVTVMKMTEAQIWQELDKLTCWLSPENLTCDGELTMTEVKARRHSIMVRWSQLEKMLGRKVTEDEVYRKCYGL